ncbi:hypothetical protein FNF29_03446 [Cafeteria roenbergensis]|uniref:Fucosyltransferase n=1 Tax=Cafeteria roenbergensis TaxID=33653 RepID=A0A5A8CIR7_CAFRO|nr:hypothetical protein FNF29_03446 [Cafeteria roenbergensis]|eukprot:KAA0152922.1 hypothetical protein FNF29_03446 [Cafeteria roenbergensis]
MGNRVRFVASCLLLAMVSDRALVVRFRQGYYASLADLFESPGFAWEASGDDKVASGRAIDPKDSQQLLCGDLGPDGAGPALSVSGNYYFMPFVANNPLYRAKARRWFPNGDIFGTMARVVFRPGPQVRDMMDTLLLDLGRKAGLPDGERWTCELGFQIRNDNDPVRRPQISAKEWDLYRKCAAELLPRSRRKDPRVFVATDSDPSRKICSEEVPYPFEVYGDFERSNNPKGVRKALVDLLVFSTCDIMLTSPWSSYGRVASVYAGREAYFVTDWGVPTGEPHRRFLDILRDEDGKSGCFRFLRTEPCPWQGPKGELGFNDVVRTTTCWDASMFSDVC